MYPPNFDYYRAGSVDEAVALLGQHSGARLLAGGHSLIPMLNLRLARPAALIDIGRIDSLKGISVDGDHVRIGALTTHVQIASSGDVPTALSEAAGMIGDRMVRNRGTIGGNIAHADPASDLPTVLTALGARIHATGPSGSRSINAENFFTGLLETALLAGEIVTAIEVPMAHSGSGSAYAKLSNPASQYAMVGAAAVLMMDGSRCTGASVAVGGLVPSARKAPSVEAALAGKDLSDAAIAAASRSVLDDLGNEILEDIHASASYRKAMAQEYVRRALASAMSRA